jgi:exosome complex RNA-binding protein Rrp42 (RNase PH superfamily)
MGPLDPAVTTNEAAFARAALAAGLRADGRGPADARPPSFEFSPDGATATVSLGDTLASAHVSAVLEPPYADR